MLTPNMSPDSAFARIRARPGMTSRILPHRLAGEHDLLDVAVVGAAAAAEHVDVAEPAAQVGVMTAAAASETVTVQSFERRKPARRLLPDHRPRERFVFPTP